MPDNTVPANVTTLPAFHIDAELIELGGRLRAEWSAYKSMPDVGSDEYRDEIYELCDFYAYQIGKLQARSLEGLFVKFIAMSWYNWPNKTFDPETSDLSHDSEIGTVLWSMVRDISVMPIRIPVIREHGLIEQAGNQFLGFAL